MSTLKQNKWYTSFSIHWLIGFVFILLSKNVLAQPAVIISSYYNATDVRDEWTELLVVQDNLNMTNWALRDNNSTQSGWQPEVRFSSSINPTFWNNMRAGTIIVLWHRRTSSTGANHLLVDDDKSDGYVELSVDNNTYFQGGSFGTAPLYMDVSMNLYDGTSGNGDLLQLGTNNTFTTNVHALGYRITTGGSFTGIATGSKMNHSADLLANETLLTCPGNDAISLGNPAQVGTAYTTKAAGQASFGLPNTSATYPTENITFWKNTRAPAWNAPTLTAVPQAGNTQVLLTWSTYNELNPSDTSGKYLILRNTVDVFTDPVDGHTYSPGNLIGSATVIGRVNAVSAASQTFTDNFSVNCGTAVYYRVYAYRYRTDQIHGNDYDQARGSAYNETSFGAAQIVSPAAPTAYNITGASGYCDGTAGVTVQLSNSETGISYDLFMDCGSGLVHIQGPIGGFTGTPISFLPQTISAPGPCILSVVGSVTANPACTSNMLNTLPVSIYPTPVFTLTHTDPSTCLGTDGTITLHNLPATSNYTLSYSANGTAVTPTPITTNGSGEFVITGLTAGNYTNIILTTALGCTSLAGSQVLNDPPPVTPSVSIAADNSSVCAGSLVTFTATPVSGGSSPAFLWRKNGISVGGNSTTYSDNSLVSTDIINCRLTSSDNCATPDTALSNNVSVTVNNSLTPAVSIEADNDTICVGTLVTFTATPTNGGTSPSYLWTKNGLTVGTNSPAYSDNTLASIDVILCEMTSSDGCAVPANAQSAPVSVLVTSSITPSIGIIADTDTTCAGNLVNFTATPANAGSAPDYQWQKNGGNVGSNQPTYTDATLISSDVITCMLTSHEACASPSTVNSNPVSVVITNILVPSISITADNLTVCNGTTVNFSASYNNGGPTPTFLWRVNGINAGTNSSSFATILNNGDIVQCILTSSDACASPGTAQSNSISITVTGTVSPAITIQPSTNPLCEGETVTFSSTVSNQGTAPAWQWKVNGSPTGTNSSSFTMVAPVDGDLVECILTSSESCASPTTAGSNLVALVVNNLPTITSLNTVNAVNGVNGSVTVTSSDPSAQFSLDGITWSTNGSFSPLTPNTYTMWVLGGNLCITKQTFTISDQVVTTMFLEAGSDAACQDDLLKVTLFSQGLNNFNSFSICISYDATVAGFLQASYTHPSLGSISATSGNPGELILQFNNASPISIPVGDSLVTLEFTALLNGTSQVQWDNFMPGVCGIFDNTGVPLIPAFTPGQLTVYKKDQAVIMGNTDICIGNSIELVAQASSQTNSWVLPDQSVFLGSQILVPSAIASDGGYYKLNTLNGSGCSDTDSVSVNIHDLPVISVSSTDLLCAELPHQLDAGGGFTEYLWQNGNTGQSIITDGEGEYWVKVKDPYGCEASDSVSLVPCPASFYIPTGFTPNHDGKNDVFRVGYTDPDIPANYKLVIYNRWGQLLYESTNISEGWDGKINGEPCPTGVYTYILFFTKPTGKTFSQESPLKGMITVVR